MDPCAKAHASGEQPSDARRRVFGEVVHAPGETGDQLYVWFPGDRVVFAGDDFYSSWPNLYPIRGAPYRDVQA